MMAIQVSSLAEWERMGVPGMLSVVIPAHNEGAHIVETVRGIVGVLQKEKITFEIIVVNDSSIDETEERVKSLISQIPELRCLNNDAPNGFGFAVRRGLANFRGDVVAIVMADASDLPADLVVFYRKLQEGYDCIFGSRFGRGGRVVGYPLPKLILNRLGNKFIQLLFRIPCNDITNAFKMYRRSVIAGIQPLLARHFNLTVEMPLKAVVRGYRYAVVPNSWIKRTHGKSKFRIKELGSRYFFIVLYCYLERMLGRQDIESSAEFRETQLQVWHR